MISGEILIAVLTALLGIDRDEVQKWADQGQIVLAGMIAIDDVLRNRLEKILPVGSIELFLEAMIALGKISTPHNSGEDGIGADPAGSGSVTVA